MLKKLYNDKTKLIFFNTFVFLFVFSMINRELKIFNFDIRIFTMLLSIIILGMNYITKSKRIIWNRTSKYIIAFFIFSFLSNIMWIWNDLSINMDAFKIITISYIYNFISFLCFYINKEKISYDFIYKSLLFSIFILMISMVIANLGIDLREGFFSGAKGFVKDLSLNFLGGTYRTAGYAQDPNYASFFVVLTLSIIIYNLKNKLKYKYISMLMIPILIYGLLISASKTVLLAIVFSLIVTFILYNFKSYKKYINITVITIVLIAIVLVLLQINLKDYSITMYQRFSMWSRALELFENSPLIGNGLTSFRSYFTSIGGWYVQPHSTIFQILSEIGVCGLFLWLIIILRNLKYENKIIIYCNFLYLIFSINTETVYHAFSIFIFGVLPLIFANKEKLKKKTADVFIINALSNGGAERVVSLMANNVKSNKAIIITMYNDKSYNFSKKVAIINLGTKKNKKILKILYIPILTFKLNREISKISEMYEIKMITSHLIYSQLITRLSIVSKNSIYVNHVSYSSFNIKRVSILKKFLQFVFNKRKLVNVSAGLENEMRQKYLIKSNKITTIYNPIDFKEIEKKLNKDNVVAEEKYFLFCGRLTEVKRPDLAIEIFYRGKFYKQYKLLMLGQGEMETQIKAMIEKYNLEKSVILKGFQSNVYKYMKNAELFISTSSFEAFPMTQIEALSTNCKLVSFDIDFGPREILINDLEQFLVKNNDIDAMIKTIKKALNKYPSNLEERVKQFDIAKIMGEYYSFNEECQNND